jgi:hypothetical protein
LGSFIAAARPKRAAEPQRARADLPGAPCGERVDGAREQAEVGRLGHEGAAVVEVHREEEIEPRRKEAHALVGLPPADAKEQDGSAQGREQRQQPPPALPHTERAIEQRDHNRVDGRLALHAAVTAAAPVDLRAKEAVAAFVEIASHGGGVRLTPTMNAADGQIDRPRAQERAYDEDRHEPAAGHSRLVSESIAARQPAARTLEWRRGGSRYPAPRPARGVCAMAELHRLDLLADFLVARFAQGG